MEILSVWERLSSCQILCVVMMLGVIMPIDSAANLVEEREPDLKEAVVLLHGLARTPRSMRKMERALEAEGYHVLNLGYPSRRHGIEDLASWVRHEIVDQIPPETNLHFVTHSLGGILVRWMQQEFPLPHEVKRMVMLSPPNHGSEIVDRLGNLRLFGWLNGPAGAQLGTGPEGAAARLGEVNFEVGVITGNRSVNPMLSQLLPGKDDGKVTVKSAQLPGMRDFLVVPHSHPVIMKKERVIAATIHFLQRGRFAAE